MRRPPSLPADLLASIAFFMHIMKRASFLSSREAAAAVQPIRTAGEVQSILLMRENLTRVSHARQLLTIGGKEAGARLFAFGLFGATARQSSVRELLFRWYGCRVGYLRTFSVAAKLAYLGEVGCFAVKQVSAKQLVASREVDRALPPGLLGSTRGAPLR